MSKQSVFIEVVFGKMAATKRTTPVVSFVAILWPFLVIVDRCAHALLRGVNSKSPRSFTPWTVGKALCLLSAVTYGLATALIDIFDPHHLQNPGWPGHAKLHLLWLISSGAIGAFISIYLFWTATPRSLDRIRTGALLGAIHIAGFFTAAIFKNMANAEFDADGRVLFGFLPPAMLHLGLSATLLSVGVFLCHKKEN